MADNNLKTTAVPSGSGMPSVSAGNPVTSVVSPAPAVAKDDLSSVTLVKDDDYLDLDSIYDLAGDSAALKNQAALSTNAPVPTANLESFRAQSGTTSADGAADSQVLADLVAKSKNTVPAPVVPSVSSPVVGPVSDVKPVEDDVLDPNWLKKLSKAVTTENKIVDNAVVAPNPDFDFNKGSDIPRIEIDNASIGSSMDKIQDQANENKVSDDAINAKKIGKVDLDIDAAKLDYSTPSPGVSFKEIPAKPSISEAAKIEEDLNARTIDLDAELKDDNDLPDLFDASAPVKPEVSALPIASVDDLNVNPQLSKVKLTKTAGGDERRTVSVQKLMKTDTIYNRGDKKEINLTASLGDKKLKSPVEELSEMTLDDWSRLGDIPSERAAKIKEKIAALGAKSIISEVEGLNAWRRSAVHQKYLDLGLSAMLSARSLEEIISDQKDMNLDEWFTINQLNRELMI